MIHFTNPWIKPIEVVLKKKGVRGLSALLRSDEYRSYLMNNLKERKKAPSTRHDDILESQE